jgi:hypothetical protein
VAEIPIFAQFASLHPSTALAVVGQFPRFCILGILVRDMLVSRARRLTAPRKLLFGTALRRWRVIACFHAKKSLQRFVVHARLAPVM